MKLFVIAAIASAVCVAQPPAEKASGAAYRAIVQEAQAHVKRVDVQQFQTLRQAHPDFVFIDVRESEEWVKGHAAKALHISRGMLEKEIEGKVPAKDTTIVLYCHSGARSALAAESLVRMGYRNAYSLDGGLTAYEAAGLPMEK